MAATSSISFVSSVLPAVDATSTTGAAPDTVTVSATVASSSPTSMRAVKPTVSRTFGRWIGRKPDSSNATWKTPIGNGARRYSPTSFVTAVTCGTCKAGLVAVTVTPGSTPPLWSVTCPMMLAPEPWPAATELEIGNKNKLAKMKTSPHRTSDVLLCMVVLSVPMMCPAGGFPGEEPRRAAVPCRCLRGRPTESDDDTFSNAPRYAERRRA